MESNRSSARRAGRHIAVLLLLSGGLGTGAGVASAQRALPVFQAASYASRTGRCVLSVDPTERSAHGPARYRLERDGALAWERELPVCVRDAAVGEDGVVFGYGYGDPSPETGGSEQLVVVLLDAQGTTVALRYMPRTEADPNDVDGRSSMLDPFLVEEWGLGVLRVSLPVGEVWRRFHLASGEELETLRPDGAVDLRASWRGRVLGVRPVPGTGLLLVHWSIRPLSPSGSAVLYGALFALLDADLEPAWQLRWDDDYTEWFDRRSAVLERMLAEHGVLAQPEEGGDFALCSIDRREKASFVVERDPGVGWTAREVARTPFWPEGWPTDTMTRLAEPVTVELEPLGTVRLQVERPPDNPWSDVLSWAFDEEGLVHLARRDRDGRYSLWRITTGGDVRLEHQLDVSRRDGQHERWTWLGDGRWLRLVSSSDDAGTSPDGRVFDERGGPPRSLGRLHCSEHGAPKACVGTGDGGFLVLDRTELFRFDSDGGRLWIRGEKPWDPDDQTGLFRPVSVTVTATGEVAVLDSVRQTVQLFAPDGGFLRVLDLEEILGGERDRPTLIRPDGTDGVLLSTTDGEPSHYRVALDGTLRAELRPRYPNGRKVVDARVAPDGGLWALQGGALLELDEEGVVVGRIGPDEDLSQLHHEGAFGVDHDGRILLQDRGTAAVHVFSPSGERLLLTRPAPTDRGSFLGIARLCTGFDGRIHVQELLNRSRVRRYLTFARDGSRRGMVDLGGDDAVFVPGTALHWVKVPFERLRLLDADGNELRSIDARPVDGHPIGNAEDFDVDRDGNLAVLAYDSDRTWEHREYVALYSSVGAPQRTLVLPRLADGRLYGICRRGDWILLTAHGSVVHLLRVDGDRLFRHAVPLETASGEASPPQSWSSALSPDGRELWMLGRRDLVLRRFAMPE